MTPELAAWRKGGTWTLHRGHRIFFRDHGDGPLLILLHGFPSATFDFAAIEPSLTAHFRVIACDFIGFGLSEKPPKYPYSLVDQANLVTALARKVGVREAHLLAHDYGVSVAQELIARTQEDGAQSDSILHIKSVCYLNGGIFPEMHRPRFVQKLLVGPFGRFVARFMSERLFRRGMRDIFGPATPPSDAFLADTWWQLRQDDGHLVLPKLLGYMAERRIQRDRWVNAVLDSPIPSRLISGPEDPVSGGAMADRYEADVQNADVVRLPGIGHYPQVEAPEAVRDAFFAFHRARGALRYA